jgi:glycine hydroxymethyltransferase
MTPAPWLPAAAAALAAEVEASLDPAVAAEAIERLVTAQDAVAAATINLNPAANVMNPRAEALLARGLSTRPALGPPGAKHETGVEAIGRIELIAAGLACRLFAGRIAEIRLPSGSLANLAAFHALTEAGDTVIVPPAAIGGHASHHRPGAAGLRGLRVLEAPVDAGRYAIDLDGLRALARAERPALIVAGGSLNLFPPHLAELHAIADEAGARFLYDAAHVAGLIAGGAWPQPLAEGADLLTMSTYKSLGGPAGGLIVASDPVLAERIDRVAFPGLTANSDAGRAAALAVALADAHKHGAAYAAEMIASARALAEALAGHGVAVYAAAHGFTASHQFAIEAGDPAAADAAVRRLRAAGLLATTIGLPGDRSGRPRGIRMGTPEVVRRGLTAADMPELAGLIAEALRGPVPPEAVAARVTALRSRFRRLRFLDLPDAAATVPPVGAPLD